MERSNTILTRVLRFGRKQIISLWSQKENLIIITQEGIMIRPSERYNELKILTKTELILLSLLSAEFLDCKTKYTTQICNTEATNITI